MVWDFWGRHRREIAYFESSLRDTRALLNDERARALELERQCALLRKELDRPHRVVVELEGVGLVHFSPPQPRRLRDSTTFDYVNADARAWKGGHEFWLRRGARARKLLDVVRPLKSARVSVVQGPGLLSMVTVGRDHVMEGVALSVQLPDLDPAVGVEVEVSITLPPEGA